jgi:hypothetical protein
MGGRKRTGQSEECENMHRLLLPEELIASKNSINVPAFYPHDISLVIEF